MKVIKWIFKFLGGALLFLVMSVCAVYFTLDISLLTPSIEQVIEHKTGLDVDLKGLRWAGIDRIAFDQIKLTWPLTAEEEAAWDSYRTAKRAKKTDETIEIPPRPLPALSLCATDVSTAVGLSELVQGESAVLYFDGLILSCLDSPGSLAEGVNRRLQAKISAKHEHGIFGEIPKTGFELKLKGSLSDVPTEDIQVLIDQLPLKVSGSVNAQFNLTLPMTRRMTLQQRKGDGTLSVEVSQLRNEKGLVGIVEIPKMNLGEIKANLNLKQGTIHLNEFTIRSPELTGEVTGSIGIRSTLSRLSLKSHISLELSPEFVKNTPEIKQIAMLQRKFFKPKGEGYHVGIELRGPISRLKPTAKEYSPFSKEGRAQQRENRSNVRPQKPAKATRATRPKSPARSVTVRETRQPVRKPVESQSNQRISQIKNRRTQARSKLTEANPVTKSDNDVEVTEDQNLDGGGGEELEGGTEGNAGEALEGGAIEEDLEEKATEEEGEEGD